VQAGAAEPPTRKQTKPRDARFEAPLLLMERLPLLVVSNQPDNQVCRKPALAENLSGAPLHEVGMGGTSAVR